MIALKLRFFNSFKIKTEKILSFIEFVVKYEFFGEE